MKSVLGGFLCMLLILPLLSCTPQESERPRQTELTTFEEKASYAVGFNVGSSLLQTQADINKDLVVQGLEDALTGTESLLSENEARDVMMQFQQQARQRDGERRRAEGDQNRTEGEAYLAENAKREGVIVTDSGLQYEVLTQGDGPKPVPSDRVKVHYRGTLIDGTEFDSSFNRGEPTTFGLTQVIPGWTEALQLMNVGSKFRVVIPSNLAYRERGQGPLIGPHAVLIFEMELLEIVK